MENNMSERALCAWPVAQRIETFEAKKKLKTEYYTQSGGGGSSSRWHIICTYKSVCRHLGAQIKRTVVSVKESADSHRHSHSHSDAYDVTSGTV